MKSFMANPSNIERKWFVVDAADKTLGRMAAEVAKVLRGNINRLLPRTWTPVIT
jgi:large subunit ribosomal protein L13